MLQGLKDYAKCAYYNRVTLAGFVSFVSGGVALSVGLTDYSHCNWDKAITWSGVAVLYVSHFPVYITSFGGETLAAYYRTKSHIMKFGRIHPKFQEKMNRVYCSRVGFKLAIQEATLEERL